MSSASVNRSSRFSVMDVVDGAFFTFTAAASAWFALVLFENSVARPGWKLLLLVVFWLFVAYLMLPRLHRVLTRLYVPGYFIGRTRTSDGLLGDPINLALLGSEAQLHQAMGSAGWTRADRVDLHSSLKIITSTLRRQSYPEAPVSPLHLFDRQQDFAYQQELAGSPSKRHHVRFWHCPEEWMLPGGYRVDWLAAGTYDRAVGLSLFTLQVTHKIEENTDVERDFIVGSLREAAPQIGLEVIRNFSTGYHSRNGGGDTIQTDGDLPIVDLRQVAAPGALEEMTLTDSRDRRPGQTVFGSGVAIARAAYFVVMAVMGFVAPSLTGVADFAGQAEASTTVAAATMAVFLLLGATFDLGVGLASLAGRNWARLLLMLGAVVITLTAFISGVGGDTGVTLPYVGTNILVLLALSSHQAREYAVRRTAVRKSGGLDVPATVAA